MILTAQATAKISKLNDRILHYQEQITNLQYETGCPGKSKNSQSKHFEETLAEKDAAIRELQNRLVHVQTIKDHDVTNTGIPTSQTPPGKGKIIPNSQGSSGKPKGGQPDHKKHFLSVSEESGATGIIRHGDGGEDFCCPDCSGRRLHSDW